MAGLRVTIKEVAERAGVSPMTVSRVLRNQPYTRRETRERVLRAVDEVGYRPNPLVGAWMTHMRSSKARVVAEQTLAFVTAEQEPDGWRENLTVRYYYEGAAARAEQLGFKLDHFWLGQPGMTGPRMSRILRSRGVSGLLLAPLPLPVRTVNLRWEDFASVAFGYTMRTPNLHRVTNHQIHTIRLAIEEARRLGYRRIGLALERSKDARVDYNWTTGVLPFLAGAAPKDRVPPFLPESLKRQDLVAWVRECRPEVILGGRQDMVPWLEKAGWRVPRDIGFVSLEYYPEYGPLAGVDQNSHTIGAAAVELAVEQLYYNERGVPEKPKVVMIEGCWSAGKSVRVKRKPLPGPSFDRDCLDCISWLAK